MSSVIMKLDADGDFHELATYSLEPKQALIAFYMQTEKKNFNTWEYPQDLDFIYPRAFGRGYMYHKKDITIYSREEEE